jgi:chromosome segregation ATPase
MKMKTRRKTMKEKLTEDLKKYEDEIAAINKRLSEFDAQRRQQEEQRQELITHGRRIEGIVAYLRASISAEAEPAQEDAPAENIAAQ